MSAIVTSKSWSNKEWEVTTTRGPILDSAGMEKLESDLGIPMPEMVFGHNTLKIVHNPSQLSIVFDPAAALDAVDKTYGGKTKILQVAHSGEWKASKIKHKKETPPPTQWQVDYDIDKVHKPFDWTYTTAYEGTFSPQTLQPASANEGIPYDELRKPEPILFFDEVQLYEDELGDFGLTTYSIKIRVMPKNLFVLARLYMRVDNVAFRIRDTRIYIDFETNTVIREYTEKESAYDAVKKRVPVWEEDFNKLLRDPDWINSVMQAEKKSVQSFKLPPP